MSEQNKHNQWNQNMLRAAVVLGVLSLLTCMMIYLAVPFGAMAILFVFLSRGRNKHPSQARTAVTMAVIGMCASTALTGYALYRYFHDPVIHMQVNRLIDYYRGIYLEEDLLDLVNSEADTGTEADTEAQQPSGMDHDSLMEYYLKPHNTGQSNIPEEDVGAVPDMTVPEGSFT